MIGSAIFGIILGIFLVRSLLKKASEKEYMRFPNPDHTDEEEKDNE